MIPLLVLAAGIAGFAPASQAFTKCQRGGKTLYTQDAHCPAGHTPVSPAAVGTVSTIGKSETIRLQERDFLAARAGGATPNSGAVTTDSVQASPPAAAACQALADQAREIEASMRRPNGTQWQDGRRQKHRSVRDQQYRMGC